MNSKTDLSKKETTGKEVKPEVSKEVKKETEKPKRDVSATKTSDSKKVTHQSKLVSD
jgi:hypothetical protein